MEDVSRQIGELRKEMHSGFKGVRSEIKDVRSELSAQITGVRSEISDVRSEINNVRSETTVEFRAMRAEMAALNRTVLASMIGGFSSLAAAVLVIAL